MAEIIKLNNGLRLVLEPCEAESIAVGFFVQSGSRYETAETAGISHFIEHMLFKGTPTRSALDITKAIEGRGGDFNAGTGEDSTCYFAHLPKEYLAEIVDILSDMYLNATIDPEEFALEKRVIIEEIKMYADDPESVLTENLQLALFPQSQLGKPIAGSVDSLSPMMPDDLHRYIKTHYHQNNTIIVIAGSFDRAQAIDIVAEKMGGFQRCCDFNPEVKEDFVEPIHSVSVEKETQQAKFALGYRIFGYHDRRRYIVGLLKTILGGGMSSRLFQEVREKRGLSYDISAHLENFCDAGIFSFTAGIDVNNINELQTILQREIEDICNKPVNAEELMRAKEFMIGHARISWEQVKAKMFYYAKSVMMDDKLRNLAEEMEIIRNITAEEIRAVAESVFVPSMNCVSLVLPKKS